MSSAAVIDGQPQVVVDSDVVHLIFGMQQQISAANNNNGRQLSPTLHTLPLVQHVAAADMSSSVTLDNTHAGFSHNSQTWDVSPAVMFLVLCCQVEATKFTELGFVGRDVDEIVKDLMEASLTLTRMRLAEALREVADRAAEGIILATITGLDAEDATRRFGWAVLHSGP